MVTERDAHPAEDEQDAEKRDLEPIKIVVPEVHRQRRQRYQSRSREEEAGDPIDPRNGDSEDGPGRRGGFCRHYGIRELEASSHHRRPEEKRWTAVPINRVTGGERSGKSLSKG